MSMRFGHGGHLWSQPLLCNLVQELKTVEIHERLRQMMDPIREGRIYERGANTRGAYICFRGGMSLPAHTAVRM